jgi:predicted type IV restriction endonuclease
MHNREQVRIFVEAKRLGERLDDRKLIAQVLNYAVIAGVQWCVLTDGMIIGSITRQR